MFASNEKVTAEQIRELIGCFKNIQSILMGLVDCVVFPQRGERPHLNESLDGDLCFVSWGEDLIPPETEPPMDYNGQKTAYNGSGSKPRGYFLHDFGIILH
ncbi:hypothetical protein MLD38_012551 [Melastoma candidum]|uniref:Uncharacterized protein n=1 Tax=Melastoma candidum TaxID=119954 RepID=A0ACB9R9S6_9MYRT|nr:hypothetical protein MLD38_012551 [Melastoma candidum]